MDSREEYQRKSRRREDYSSSSSYNNNPRYRGNDRFDDRDRFDRRPKPANPHTDSFEYSPRGPKIPTGPRADGRAGNGRSLASRITPNEARTAPEYGSSSSSRSNRRDRRGNGAHNRGSNNGAGHGLGPGKRPREEPRSPRHDSVSDRRKLPAFDHNRGLKNLPSGPKGSGSRGNAGPDTSSSRNGPPRDSFVPSNNKRAFNKPTQVLKSRSALGFNDEMSDDDTELEGRRPRNERRPPHDRRQGSDKPNNARAPRKPKQYLIFGNAGVAPYEKLAQVGEGTYGKVYKAKNNVTGKLVAMKRLRLELEKEGFPITLMRETSLLQSFQHENVSGLLEMMCDRNVIYMVFDYLEHDLTALLAHPAVELTVGHCKDLFRQLLFGMKYLHEKKIMHRDIKGSNILINRHGVLKITDFGLARKMKSHKPEESPQYTNRVITLWYRPPELLMGATDYGQEVDMWGLGCLLLELFTKKAAFQGNNEISQLAKVFKIMGTPSYDEWPEMDDLPWYHVVRPGIFPRVFNATFNGLLRSEACIQLCEGLLLPNPRYRTSAKVLIESRWFAEEPLPERLKLEGFEELHEFEVKKRRKAKQAGEVLKGEVLKESKESLRNSLRNSLKSSPGFSV